MGKQARLRLATYRPHPTYLGTQMLSRLTMGMYYRHIKDEGENRKRMGLGDDIHIRLRPSDASPLLGTQ